MLYLEYTDEELDAQYDTSRQVGDGNALLLQRKSWSAIARDQMPGRFELSYGEAAEETLDFYPSEKSDAPVVVFIHGGFWSTPILVKELYAWTALGMRAHGFSTAVLDYGVCPDYSIGQLVQQGRNAIAWLYKNAQAYGGDGSKIYIVGHSAGGHMAAMAALPQWKQAAGLPIDTVKGICAISGLFDLRPFPRTWLQTKLGLTPEEVKANSPLFHLSSGTSPMLIAFGADESDEFQRQSAAMFRACRDLNIPAGLMPLPGLLHNSAIEGLFESSSQLCEAIALHFNQSMAK